MARIPRDRPRRPEPVGLLPRRRRPPPACRRRCTRAGSRCSSTTTRGTPAPGGPATTRPSWPRWSPSSPIDGVFLDTLKEGGTDLLDGLAAARAGVAVEGESTLPLERLADHPLSWAQWFADSQTPGIVRSHWFERRHQMHHVRRWHRDHAEELQSAWLNGIGVMVWEVVFGVWVGWSDRDAQTLRRMATASGRCTTCSSTVTGRPWYISVSRFAPQGFSAPRSTSSSERVTALVNRSTTEAMVPVAVSGERTAYDLWTGRLVGGRGRGGPRHRSGARGRRCVGGVGGCGCLVASG